jgi:hypothetical protein
MKNEEIELFIRLKYNLVSGDKSTWKYFDLYPEIVRIRWSRLCNRNLRGVEFSDEHLSKWKMKHIDWIVIRGRREGKKMEPNGPDEAVWDKLREWLVEFLYEYETDK